MPERSPSRTPDPHPVCADPHAPRLVCFSHLRWDFVWQRPQHLLTRAARQHRVLFVEEPIFRLGARAHVEIGHRPGGITVAVPVLPEGLGAAEVIAAQRTLVDGLLARETDASGRILWYYTPMALPFSRHLDADLVVYDCMDELSAFRGAPPELVAARARRCSRAPTWSSPAGMSLYEAKRSRHRQRPRLSVSSVDVAHFATARGRRRRSGGPGRDRRIRGSASSA